MWSAVGPRASLACIEVENNYSAKSGVSVACVSAQLDQAVLHNPQDDSSREQEEAGEDNVHALAVEHWLMGIARGRGLVARSERSSIICVTQHS